MRVIAAIAFLFFLTLSSTAQDRIFKNEFGFKSDNDAYLFYGQDRYYTNGLFIYFRHANDQQKTSDKVEKTILEISAGQKMYNPASGYRPDPATHDRPFAGYLYAGAAYSWFYKNESVIKTELQIGTVGPSSLAQDGQELLHDIVGFYTIDGWQYQIKDEFAVNTSTTFTKKLYRSKSNKVDFSGEGNLNLGTTFSGASAGILFRAGKINQLFSTSALNSAIGNNVKTKALNNSELYFYAKPQLSYIAYDATIQGSMFKNNSPVTFGVKPVVFSQLLGFNYSMPRFTLDYSMIFKSKEVKSTAMPHQFGSISMYYRFN